MKWIKLLVFIIYSMTVYLCCNKILCAQTFYVIKVILKIPICLYIVLILHELSHLLFLKIFKMQITEMRISLLLVNMRYEKIRFSLADSGFFYGYCKFKLSDKEQKTKAIISLLSGGLSGAVVSVFATVFFLIATSETWKTFVSSLFLTGLYSFYTTLLRKNSADRTAIEDILKRKMFL